MPTIKAYAISVGDCVKQSTKSIAAIAKEDRQININM